MKNGPQTPERRVAQAIAVLVEHVKPEHMAAVVAKLLETCHKHMLLMVDNPNNEDDIDIYKHGAFPWI